MRLISAFLLTGSMMASSLFAGGLYVLPRHFDNTVMSVGSKITVSYNYNVTLGSEGYQWSSNSYTIAGKTAKYLCKKIKKIECSNAEPKIYAELTEASLRHPDDGRIVNTWATDLRIEEDSGYWYVCFAAYGGNRWDTVNLNSTPSPDGRSVSINLEYIPISKSEDFFYFIDDAAGQHSSDSAKTSYAIISVQQICK